MTNEERIKQYFEEIIKTDPAIAAVYDEKKLKDCCSYIFKQARKAISGSSGFVADEVVFKWARDFMLGDIEQEKKPDDKKTTEDVAEETEVTEEIGEDSQNNETDGSESEEVIDESVDSVVQGESDSQKGGEASIVVPELPEHKCVDDGETSTEDFVVVSDGEIKHRCNECGYIHITESCHQDEGLCLFKRNNGFADNVVKLQSIACSQFIKLATDDDIKPIKEKLQIEKVEEESAEEIQPVVQKEKKAAVQEYEQPSLFDDLF